MQLREWGRVRKHLHRLAKAQPRCGDQSNFTADPNRSHKSSTIFRAALAGGGLDDDDGGGGGVGWGVDAVPLPWEGLGERTFRAKPQGPKGVACGSWRSRTAVQHACVCRERH